jgi:hypothetical protein
MESRNVRHDHGTCINSNFLAGWGEAEETVRQCVRDLSDDARPRGVGKHDETVPIVGVPIGYGSDTWRTTVVEDLESK